ncbi:MAG: protein-tyrosine-phosphatase [Gemmatales bacterium]|nr:MAG: protein-tyrosine-phosphatase [Gemmatales bacterium]
MAEILSWRTAPDLHDVVSRGVAALAAGECLIFPTDTGYAVGVAAKNPQAFERLRDWRSDLSAPTLSVREASEAVDWMPSLGACSQRLARRCWPGPLELVWDISADAEPFRSLPEPVREHLCQEQKVKFGCPSHEAIFHCLQRYGEPILYTDLEHNGEGIFDSEKLRELVGEREAVVIEDGVSRFKQMATVVAVRGEQWRIVREGIIPHDMLEKLAACLILFVCTGNTCRSPLAAALFRKLLCERLHCRAEELLTKGYWVESAGLAAVNGARATAEAQTVARELGTDLERHASQPISTDLVFYADYLIGMTNSHVQLMKELFPDAYAKPRLLAADQSDLPDPIGGDVEVYRECGRQILKHLQALISEVCPT